MKSQKLFMNRFNFYAVISKNMIKAIHATLMLLFISSTFANGTKSIDPELKEKTSKWMSGQKALGFRENKGQMTGIDDKPASFVLFKAEVPNLNIWVTTTGLTYQFFKMEEEAPSGSPVGGEHRDEGGEGGNGEWHRVDMVLKGATIKKENIVTEGNITQGEVNYYLGHCPDGVFNVKTYTKITFKEVYKGIDWVLYTSKEGGIKHDFIVHPGAEPDQVKLVYEGSGELNVKDDQIHFENELGEIAEGKLLCYQNNGSTTVESAYAVKKCDAPLYLGAGNIAREAGLSFVCKSREGVFSSEISFVLKKYDKSSILVIDPQLVWGTFFGGNGFDGPMTIDCDGSGNIYITGYFTSTNFPLQTWGAAYQDNAVGDNDACISRFTNSGLLTWSTYFGGGNYEVANSLIFDGTGNIYTTGMTFSSNFPVMFLAGAYNDAIYAGGVLGDVFVARFSNSGILTWATYFGGTGKDCGEGITCDGNNNIYLTGFTESANFPIQNLPGAYNDNSIGGTRDIFILKFSSSCALNWSTYYGGTGSDGNSWMSSIVCDGSNNVYIVSDSNGGFPTQALVGGYNDNVFGGGFGLDAVILKFNNSGACVWATYYGGAGDELGTSIRCDLSGNLYVEGTTNSTSVSFLTVPWGNAYYQSALGGGSDIFILRFTNAGVLTWATYYGGSLNERIQTADNIEIDDCGNVYVSFETLSTNIFTTGNASCVQSYYDSSFNGGSFGGDLFIIKFNNVGSVVWATYFGGNGNDVREALALDSAGNLFITGEWVGVVGTENSYPILNPGGGVYYDNTANGVDDGYIAKFIPVVPDKTQSQVNSSACGPCNGSATITLTCSEADYSYTWSNGSSTINSSNTSNTISGLCAGSYTVTVTSNCNQTQTTSFIITTVPCSGISATVNSASMCSGTTPCPTLTAAGSSGAAPYTYLWSTSATTASISPCPSGSTNYTVTITDNAGSTATSVAIVTVNAAVSVTATPSNVTCSGGTGSVSAAGAGGSIAYTYNWSSGQTSQTVTGLSAGAYSVTITDSKGCSSTSTTAIVSPSPLVGQFAKGTASCALCGCKDWLMVNASGGTSPYSYTWPDGYSNRYKNQLCPGTYTINIKDKNGCSVNVNLSAP